MRWADIVGKKTKRKHRKEAKETSLEKEGILPTRSIQLTRFYPCNFCAPHDAKSFFMKPRTFFAGLCGVWGVWDKWGEKTIQRLGTSKIFDHSNKHNTHSHSHTLIRLIMHTLRHMHIPILFSSSFFFLFIPFSVPFSSTARDHCHSWGFVTGEGRGPFLEQRRSAALF